MVHQTRSVHTQVQANLRSWPLTMNIDDGALKRIACHRSKHHGSAQRWTSVDCGVEVTSRPLIGNESRERKQSPVHAPCHVVTVRSDANTVAGALQEHGQNYGER